VFSLFNIDKQEYVNPYLRRAITKQMALESVPVIDPDFKFNENTSVDKLVQMADGYSDLNPKAIREGLVFNRYERRDSFKAISNQFLLNED
jgi:hypothetical protein